MTSQPIVVWSEIQVSDMQKAVVFNNEVFDWQMTIDESGPNPMAILGGDTDAVGGHKPPGPAARPLVLGQGLDAECSASTVSPKPRMRAVPART